MDGYQALVGSVEGMGSAIHFKPLHANKRLDIDLLQQLTQLINHAYRGVSGSRRWTTEQHLIDGDRITEQDLDLALADPTFEMFIAETADREVENRIIACIVVKHLAMGESAATCEFGTFAVLPELQGGGLGKALLCYAENQVRSRCSMFQVEVVEANADLIRFYQKRGYELVGESIPYPTHLHVGIPKQSGLELVVLRKPA